MFENKSTYMIQTHSINTSKTIISRINQLKNYLSDINEDTLIVRSGI